MFRFVVFPCFDLGLTVPMQCAAHKTLDGCVNCVKKNSRKKPLVCSMAKVFTIYLIVYIFQAVRCAVNVLNVSMCLNIHPM